MKKPKQKVTELDGFKVGDNVKCLGACLADGGEGKIVSINPREKSFKVKLGGVPWGPFFLDQIEHRP